ncbi:MAG: ABC transporter permease [Puniceicoccales bacterium]|jgi:NitT/TauT family transport system permease protein|nr:ABC transporter permease [Puniceicoccales bacterium]
MKHWLVILATFAAVLFALEGIGHNSDNADSARARLLPLPTEVAAYLWASATDGVSRHKPPQTIRGGKDKEGGALPSSSGQVFAAVLDSTLVEAAHVTLKRLIFGYLTGFALGIPLGLISARFDFFRETVGLVALGLQGLPSVCWVPLALIWFGPTESAILFVVVMGTLWSLMLATEQGVRTVPPLYIRAARTMGSGGLHLWRRVLLPAALPVVMSGMKQGWAFAWRSLMAAEIYVTILSGYGLGWLLHNGREMLRMDQVIGVMLLIVLIGLAADRALFAPAEKWLRARWGLDKE